MSLDDFLVSGIIQIHHYIRQAGRNNIGQARKCNLTLLR